MHGSCSTSISSDSKYLAHGTKDGKIKIIDLLTGLCDSWLEGHTSSIVNLSFSIDRKLLASCSKDNTLHIWNVDKNDPTYQTHKSFIFPSSPYSCSFFPNNGFVACSVEKFCHIIDITSGKYIHTVEESSDMHVLFSNNGKYLINYQKRIPQYCDPLKIVIYDANSYSKLYEGFSRPDKHGSQDTCTLKYADLFWVFKPEIIGLYQRFINDRIIVCNNSSYISLWDIGSIIANN